MTTRSEQMADFDRSEDARRHRQYIHGLRATRETVLNGAVAATHYVAHCRVVRAIDKLIAEAERTEA